MAVDEVRFQVQLNWLRSQYYLVLNLGVVTAAVGIGRLGTGTPILTAALYFLGLATATVAILANRTQQEYYRATRDEKAKKELMLDLGPFAIKTTPGMGSERRRFGTVYLFTAILLALIAIIDIVGIIYSLAPWLRQLVHGLGL